MSMRNALRRGANLPIPKKPLHGTRKIRYFAGWAYPPVGTGEQIRELTIELSDDNIAARKHYDDPANMLHLNDITGTNMQLTGIIGKPVMVNHGYTAKYGHGVFGVVESAILEPDNRIYVTGAVYGADADGVDNELAMDAIGEMDAGLLGSLSLRWRTLLDEKNTVLSKDVLELSLCREPHYANCVITNACSQPSSVARKYTNTGAQSNFKEVERLLSFTMSASAEPLAAAPALSQPAAPTSGGPDTATMIQELTRKLQEADVARRKAEQDYAAAQQWKNQKEAEETARINAMKETALKPLPELLQTLQKHGEVQAIHKDTAEMLAHVMAEPVVNANQQLGQLITACSAKLETQDKELVELRAQVKRIGNASSAAELTMAASAAERMMDLVQPARPAGRTGQGAVDPMYEQSYPSGVFKAGDLPPSFYGDGWSIPVQNVGSSSFARRLEEMRSNVGVGMSAMPLVPQQRALESAASAAPVAAPARGYNPLLPQKLQQQQQQPQQVAESMTTTSQFYSDGNGASASESYAKRVALMDRQRAQDLIQVTRHALREGEELPTYRGDTW